MIIIIGTGLAGYQLAREFRRLNTTSPLMLITQDNGKYYSKPQLSTALTQKKTAEALITASSESMAAQLNATICNDTEVTSINPHLKTVSSHDKTYHYEKLVLACGSDVIKPILSGNAIKDVLSINHIYHYATFESLIKNKNPIAILGAGLIGCEFANDLSNTGFTVHVIAPDKTPLERFVPAEIGHILQEALEQKGVTFHWGCAAERIDYQNTGYQLLLSNQETLYVELVLSAIGLKPHVKLAETANLKINRGIVVNRYLETSANDIYALGDCAEVEGHVLPFITPLLNCAKALAKTLNGERTSVGYPAMPIVVKTPAHPIVICPPPIGEKGHWEIEIHHHNARALFYNNEHKLYGFVLTNEAVKERASLAKEIPGLI